MPSGVKRLENSLKPVHARVTYVTIEQLEAENKEEHAVYYAILRSKIVKGPSLGCEF